VVTAGDDAFFTVSATNGTNKALSAGGLCDGRPAEARDLEMRIADNVAKLLELR
jgi:hypothetical protein